MNKAARASASACACRYFASAQASADDANANSEFHSVREQSGIVAGDGGFNIKVNNNTDLAGGVIDSSADKRKNLLVTGTLTISDIDNTASYNSDSSIKTMPIRRPRLPSMH